MSDRKKISANIGVFAGILWNNRLLLRRRTEKDSILGISLKGCWELPGGAVYEADAETVPYCYPIQQMIERVCQEVGIKLDSEDVENKMPICYPVMLKGKSGYDLALVVPIELISEPVIPPGIEVVWVDGVGLDELASKFVPPDSKAQPPQEGQGLLSGFGKRMHCMALKVLANTAWDTFADETLLRIQESWPT